GRRRFFFLCLTAFSLIAAMGSMAPIPIWGVLHQLPFIRGLESPGRFSLLFSLGGAILAGYGVDAVWRRPSSPRLAGLVGAGGSLLVIAAVIGAQRASDW